MKFLCPHCSQKLELDAEYAGYTLTCPSCDKTITAPSDPDVTMPSESLAETPMRPSIRNRGLNAGDTIGKCRVEKELSRGGMGTVYLARHMKIVQEYVDGGSVKDLMSSGQVPLEQALDIAVGVAEALVARGGGWFDWRHGWAYSRRTKSPPETGVHAGIGFRLVIGRKAE